MTTVDVGFGRPVAAPAHVACLIASEADRARLLGFVRKGAENDGEASLVHGPPSAIAAFRAELGLPPAVAASRRVVFVEGQDDADGHLTNTVGALRRLVVGGARAVRAVGLVGWNAPSWPAPEDYLWLEAVIGPAFADLPVVLVCAFDVSRLPADALVYGGLEMHSTLLIDGRHVPNALFRSLESFMSERLVQLPWLSGSLARDDRGP